MTVEDFYKTQWTHPEKMDEFYKVGIRFSYNDMIKFANDYHESEVKKLGLSDVSGSFLCALASEKRCETQCFTCLEDQKCDELHTKNLR